MSLRKQYDGWHNRVFEADPVGSDEKAPWYRLVLDYLPALQGKRVLEIACGRGGFATALAARGGIVSGADFSETALRIASAKYSPRVNSHLDLTQADAENLPYADGSFDIVISCETIEHLPDPIKALREMARVCRPRGFLYLTTPNYFNAMGLYYIYARLRGHAATPGSDQPFDRVFVFPQIRRMVRRAGFNIIRSDGTVHQVPYRRGHNPVALPKLESNRTGRRMLSPLALHYFVMARRSDSLG